MHDLERREPAFSGVFSGTFLSAVTLALLAVLGGRGLLGRGLLRGDAEPRPVALGGELGSEERATIALFEEASRAVVQISAVDFVRFGGDRETREVPEGSGSGFVWDEAGHVVTNLHVVRDGTGFRVRFKDLSVFEAELVGAAPDYDLAVLAVAAPREKFHPLPLGASRSLRVGQRALAIGYPFGLEQTLTTGVISGLGRRIQSQSNLAIHGVIQTDAAINPGNSGGPLLDTSGRLVGVNTAIATATGVSNGVGFAVPVDTVNRIVPRILNEGWLKRAGLGIVLAEDFYARDAGLSGAVIEAVTRGLPAERAGLAGRLPSGGGAEQLGDVIVALEDQPIHDALDLLEALEVHRAGERLRVKLNRPGPSGGRVVEELTLRLAELP